MSPRDPVQELQRARQTVEEIITSLDLAPGTATALRAAAESYAKAKTVATVAEFVEARRAQPRIAVGPN